MTTCTTRDYLGAYVLHALDDDEMIAVSSHLMHCSGCEIEVAKLAGTAAHLRQLTLTDIDQALAIPAPEPNSAGPQRAPKPFRRLAAASALALTVLAATFAVLAQHRHVEGPATIHGSDRVTGVSATLSVSAGPAATHVTQLHLWLDRAYPRGTCRLIVHSRDGRTQAVATWAATARGIADVKATTTIPLTQLTNFDVITGSGHRLIRLAMPTPLT